MEFSKGIEETDVYPSIPEKIRRFVQKNLHGLLSMVIKEQADNKRWKQINKITLHNKQGEIPTQDVEEICVGIMRVIEKRDEEREEDDPFINFQILATNHSKSGGPKNPSIEYEFIAGGSVDDATFGGDEYDNPLRAIVDAQTNYISTLHYHLDESHTVIREIANNNQQAMKPLMDALGWMGHFYASGLQNQQAAFAMIYDVKKAEAEEKHKTLRHDKWIDLLKKPVGVMGAQFLPWAMAKMTGQPVVSVDDDDDDGDDDDDDGETREGQRTVTIENVEADLGLTEEQKENPVATYASALAMCLESKQWFDLSDLLRKKEVRLLRSMLEAKTDKDCVTAYEAFGEIPTSKLLQLNALLTEDQRGMLTQLGELVKAVKEKWGE